MEVLIPRGNPHVNESQATIDVDQLRGKRAVVMGLGSFGGGVGVVRFLAGRGAAVRVSDPRSDEQLADSVAELADLPDIDWRLGGQDWSHFKDADLVVINPAVRPDHPLLSRLADHGIPLTTEMNLFWQLNRGRVIAVTGSNGKSTTTALIHALLEASGRRCWLGGNIGRSLLPVVDQIEPDDWVVLELSSFQLERLNQLQARPDIAVVTNFSPNHLDWHGTVDAYAAAKQSILRWQTNRDWAVLNAADANVSSWPGSAQRVLFNFACLPIHPPSGRVGREARATGEGDTLEQAETRSAGDGAVQALPPRSSRPSQRESEVEDAVASAWLDANTIRVSIHGKVRSISRSGFRLRGLHNLENAQAAVVAALIAGVDEASIERGLSQFEPLPHRLQLVAEWEGRLFYNDSIATTPESAIAALDAFDEPIVLLAGGYDKQVDLSAFATAIGRRAKAVALLGTTSPRLAEQFNCQTPPPHLVASSFREAIGWAIEQSSPGDVVLLSPGCASYDWFRSFEDRGRQFAAIVRELTDVTAVSQNADSD